MFKREKSFHKFMGLKPPSEDWFLSNLTAGDHESNENERREFWRYFRRWMFTIYYGFDLAGSPPSFFISIRIPFLAISVQLNHPAWEVELLRTGVIVLHSPFRPRGYEGCAFPILFQRKFDHSEKVCL